MNLGGTITELQARMTLSEVQTWVAYRRKYGAFNDIRRYDVPAATIASVVNRSLGGKSKAQDFLPYGKHDDQTAIDSLEGLGGMKIKVGR